VSARPCQSNGIGEEKEEEDDDDDEGDSDDVLLTTVVRLGIVVQSVTVVATAVAMITGEVALLFFHFVNAALF